MLERCGLDFDLMCNRDNYFSLVAIFFLAFFTFYSDEASGGYPIVEEKMSEVNDYIDNKYPKNSFSIQNSDLEDVIEITKISNLLSKIWGQDDLDRVAFSNYLQSLWRLDSHHLFLVTDHPTVKLRIAALIGQAIRNCFIDADITTYQKYVRAQINSDNLNIFLDSVISLGAVGSNDDIPLLASIVKTEHQGIAENAVSSLVHLATIEAISKIRSLVPELARKSLILYISNRLRFYPEGYLGVRSQCA